MNQQQTSDTPLSVPAAEASGHIQAPVQSGTEERVETDPGSAGHLALDDAQINTSEDADEATRLAALGAATRDQDDLERDIGRQANVMLNEQADERDTKRLERATTDKARLTGQIASLEKKLAAFGNKPTKDRYRAEIDNYKAQIVNLDRDIEQIRARIDGRHTEDDVGLAHNEDDVNAAQHRQPGESHREFLIRTGKITPFSNVGRHLLRTSSSLAEVMLDAEQEASDGEPDHAEKEVDVDVGPKSHRNLARPGFDDYDEQDRQAIAAAVSDLASEPPIKRRRIQTRHSPSRQHRRPQNSDSGSGNDYSPVHDKHDNQDASESDDFDADGIEEDLIEETGTQNEARKSRKRKDHDEEQDDLAGIDDGNEHLYQSRLQSWADRRKHARQRGATTGSADDKAEWHMPHPSRADTDLGDGLTVPGDIYPSLFDYQKTGVQWLWELYSQKVGGIVGDEMGLGKTIQIISLLASLHYSKKLTKPIIVVTPATVMRQWVNEFHRWWPPFRVSILHTSGSGMLDVGREDEIEADLESTSYGGQRKRMTKGEKAAKRVLDRVTNDGHVLVTTYSGLQTYAELLMPVDWEYAVLDEGHKIRNPNTAITIFCKELRTHNRIILSGTPMQNNLTELWSLFDFVFPMRLGTLVNFRQQFEFPIKQGGYANASNLQVETAMKCAETLKDTISPYLLQRFKVDVASDLPKKSERVLFCKLTKLQRDTYEKFLSSEEMTSIINGKRHALYGVDLLRKICNHPDLVEHKTLSVKTDYPYGDPTKSGKMQIVKALLEIWKKNGHKTLLFAQHRIMLDILQRFIASMPGFNYRRMDGNTSIKDRQTLVNEFNRDPELHVFLLTTKVGGLGVNLTGANRVIIYDPDWNPSTDVQARERAWRLGQKREVEIYRLMTAGTIEEKIYHRQIFKQFLTNKILKDPKQRQTFQLRDLHDLFTLGDNGDGTTETGTLFKGTEVDFAADKDHDIDEAAKRVKAEAKAELDNITGLSRNEEFRTGVNEPSSKDAADGEAAESDSAKNDRVLSSIFARSGVHSALSHDAIINGKKKVTADPEMIAREAKRVAAAAAKELDRAGEIARTVPIGTPTWTGEFGVAGRPDSRPSRLMRGGMSSRGGRGNRQGPSSSTIMANLSARQGTSNGNTRERADPESQPKGRDFLVLIRDYLLAHGGKVYTQMLIDHFNRYCGSAQRTAEFKEMLKTIAVLEKGSRGRAKWALKEQYRARPADATVLGT